MKNRLCKVGIFTVWKGRLSMHTLDMFAVCMGSMSIHTYTLGMFAVSKGRMCMIGILVVKTMTNLLHPFMMVCVVVMSRLLFEKETTRSVPCEGERMGMRG